jgi:polyvinyl alcohol dehydrogenase (cytochrome)
LDPRLSVALHKQLAVFITGKQPGADTGPDQNANRCARPGPAMKLDVRDWNGWGRDSDNSRYQPQPGITAGNLARLKVKWVFAYPGNAVDGQPTLVGGRAFVTSRTGRVFALDAKTGCTYWSFAPEGGVRTAVTVNALPASAGAKFAVYFATENGYLHALDAETGKPVWTTRVEDHPVTRLTGSPALYKNRLYMPLASLEEVSVRNPKYACCTFRGGVVAVDAVTGAIVWKTHMIAEEPKQIGANASGTPMMGPAGVSIFSAPTIDAKQHVLYVGTGNSYTQISSDAANAIVALDLETGERRWASQVLADDDICARFDDPVSCAHRGPDYDFAASPILRRLRGGKDILVAASKAGEAYGFDPDDHGRLLWRVKLGPGTATAGTWGLAADATHVFIGSADVRPAAAAGAEIGGLSALDIATGKLLWHKVAPPPACGWEQPNGGASPPRVICSQAQPAALALIPGIVFSGSIDGHMRAFSARDGAILWDFDTAQSFEGVNGFKATGGSISNGAQTVASGALYVNSGAAGLHQPGNALIAFTIDGR